MMNLLGKSLVLVQVALSLFGLTWAASLFFLAPDWGFKQARQDLGEKVPSELDKRLAAAKDAVAARDRVLPDVKKRQDALYASMDRYAANHLFYRMELERLRTATGPIQVKEIKFQDGNLATTPPRIGIPEFDQDVQGIDKSLREYQKELKDEAAGDKDTGLYRQMKDLVEETRDWVDKSAKVTAVLKARYELLENEAQTQARTRAEIQYLQPHWAEALEQAQTYSERRARLEQGLKRLQEDLGIKAKN